MEQFPLRVLFWEATEACNLRCRHCRRPRARMSAAARELTTDEVKNLIREVADWCRPLLIVSGGEPLMRADVVELAGYAAGRELPVALATNGVLVNGGVAGDLSRAGVRRVSVSLDGVEAETHDGMRGVSGAFDSALNAIRNLKAAGVGTQINMTVCRGNRDEVEQMFLLAEREGVEAVHFFIFVPVGCGLTCERDQALSAFESEELLSWFSRNAAAAELEVRLTCAPQYLRILAGGGRRTGKRPDERTTGGATVHCAEEVSRGGRGRASGCLGGRGVCFVSHSGDVFPCGYLPVAAGTIRGQGLRETWERSPLFLELRDPSRLGLPCGTCAYDVVCGGCRARAYAATGNYMAGDRTCLNPKSKIPNPEDG